MRNEALAEALYSTMITRQLERTGLIMGVPVSWETQPEQLREDWRYVARVARDLIVGASNAE